jgi:hypothetical protein
MRQMKLKERYALTFIFFALPFWGLAIWPNAITWISKFLGISHFTVMLLAISLFLILMVFELLVIVSVLDSKVSTLAQMVGIHHEQLRLIERSNAGNETAKHHEPNHEHDGLASATDETTRDEAPHEDKIVIKRATVSAGASPDRP